MTIFGKARSPAVAVSGCDVILSHCGSAAEAAKSVV
jgi:hypothetical protein